MAKALAQAKLARDAAPALAAAGAELRSEAIRRAAAEVRASRAEIIAANVEDMAEGQLKGLPEPLLDRLLLDEARIAGIVDAMEEVARQEDPLGRVRGGRTLPNGLRLEQVSVPLGVVAIIYEARPNVTADSIALCLRSGNACVLRGGSAARRSCHAIAEACRKGIAKAGLPEDAVQLVASDDHSDAVELMGATGIIDVLIPRGGASLIKACVEQSKVPVIETGTGNCHIYLEQSADPQMCVRVCVNAKCQRPGVCNAAESLLVDDGAAEALLPNVLAALFEGGVELVGDAHARAIAERVGVSMGEATEADWGTEYLDLKMSVKCVGGVEEAISHVNRYGTHHSEAILTSSYEAAERFLQGVDAAAVYVNASTRFTDGGVFGLGAEIGISTQKLHARGPMGASALTTTKYLVRGEGQVR